MFQIHSSKRSQLLKRKYRSYSPTKMTEAYMDVKNKKLSVARAAREYLVPEQTLRDRVLGHVSAELFKSGPPPVFSVEQEVRLVVHIKYVESLGYGYTRSEVVDLGTEYAVHLGLRTEEKSLSVKWFYGLLSRWPELKLWRPKTISELRAKATSKESITKYFDELHRILQKYELVDKPQCIYNVDEKGISPNFNPPQVLGSVDHVPHVITSEKSGTTTILGCGNAVGHQIPPYFVFKGARMRQELLEGAIPGTDGDVSESGWSNSSIFQSYLENHFIKYATGGHGDQKIILLYDGHRTHITPDIIDWAISKSVILFVLPPHTSHVLQPMDVGCFGPFSKIFSAQCTKFQRSTKTVVSRNTVCSLACKAYLNALSPSNLQSAFRKSGIYPFNPSAIDMSLFIISEHLRSAEPCKEASADKTTTEESFVESDEPHLRTENQAADQQESNVNNVESENYFFEKRVEHVPVKPKPKPRRSIHKIVAGKAITETDTRDKINTYLQESVSSKSVHTSKSKSCHSKKLPSCSSVSENHTKGTKKSCSKSSKTQKRRSPASTAPKPGPSGQQKIYISDSSSDTDSDVPEEEKCCVCHLFQPKELKHCASVVFTKWGGCEFDGCGHWTHLKYCCDVNVLRRHDRFFCPCHGIPCKQVEE